jgi:psp operon transcriptional activator
LIIGERGTGKELIAQRLHYLSKRWDQPLVSLNCSTLSEGLIDSELFGHESGAFTGAKGRHQGRFERAENGTLFLDELATTPLSVQEKLLRVIEYGQYERVGGNQSLDANVRLVCATNEDLPKLATQNRFRADLLDRLAFDVIHLPPLRERHEDIALLAEYYAMKMCRELELPFFVGFSEQAWLLLNEYRWPGNVRELKNVVERAVYQHGAQETPINHLILNPFESQYSHDSQLIETSKDEEPVTIPKDQQKADISGASDLPEISFPLDFKQWQKDAEINVITRALQSAQYNQRTAAKLLGLSYDQLRGFVRKHKLV